MVGIQRSSCVGREKKPKNFLERQPSPGLFILYSCNKFEKTTHLFAGTTLLAKIMASRWWSSIIAVFFISRSSSSSSDLPCVDLQADAVFTELKSDLIDPRIWSAQKVLLTGGDSTIGREVVFSLVPKGISVVIASRDVAKGARVCELARERCGKNSVFSGCGQCTTHSLDLSDRHSIVQLAQHVTTQHSDLTTLVNNAGFFSYEQFAANPRWEQLPVEQVYLINFLGHVLLTELLLPVFLKTSFKNSTFVENTITPRSRVIHVGSDAGGWLVACGLQGGLLWHPIEAGMEAVHACQDVALSEWWNGGGPPEEVPRNLPPVLSQKNFRGLQSTYGISKHHLIWHAKALAEAQAALHKSSSDEEAVLRKPINFLAVTPGVTESPINAGVPYWMLCLGQPGKKCPKQPDEAAAGLVYAVLARTEKLENGGYMLGCGQRERPQWNAGGGESMVDPENRAGEQITKATYLYRLARRMVFAAQEEVQLQGTAVSRGPNIWGQPWREVEMSGSSDPLWDWTVEETNGGVFLHPTDG